MFGAERRQLILELVRAHGAVSVRDLARAVGVSEVTVRRDVTGLEKRGLLERRHGGAMLPGREDGRSEGRSEGRDEGHGEAADADALVLGDAATIPRTVMFGAERRRLIGELVRANKAISIADLSEAVNVSEMTVRRDLTILAKRGLLQRAHGGAVVLEPDEPVTPAPAVPGGKEAIAAMAARLVDGEDAIMLGAGTTVAEFARHLRPTATLTVLTNSVPVARVLAHTPKVELVMTSGALDTASLALVGSAAEHWMAGHRVGRAFVSGMGVTAERGLSSAQLAPSSVDRAMVGSAREVVVLADHTKLGVETTYQVAPVPRIDHLVTDGPSGRLVASLAERGVRVHVAGGPAASTATAAG